MVCNSCNGTGKKPCEMCGGHGQIRVLRRPQMDRFMSFMAPWLGIPCTEFRVCGQCGGKGTVNCTECGGTGEVDS